MEEIEKKIENLKEDIDTLQILVFNLLHVRLILTPRDFNVRNGMTGMMRDIVLKLDRICGSDEKARSIHGMSLQHYSWKSPGNIKKYLNFYSEIYRLEFVCSDFPESDVRIGQNYISVDPIRWGKNPGEVYRSCERLSFVFSQKLVRGVYKLIVNPFQNNIIGSQATFKVGIIYERDIVLATCNPYVAHKYFVASLSLAQDSCDDRGFTIDPEVYLKVGKGFVSEKIERLSLEGNDDYSVTLELSLVDRTLRWAVGENILETTFHPVPISGFRFMITVGGISVGIVSFEHLKNRTLFRKREECEDYHERFGALFDDDVG